MGRRRGLVAVLAVVLAAGAGGIWYGSRTPGATSVSQAAPPPSPTPTSPAPPSPSPSPSAAPSLSPSPVVTAVPARGTGTFDYSGTGGERAGGAGRLVRYTVATERGSAVDPEVFAAAVHATLADPRSWIAGGRVSFQRVPAGQPSELTVHLATPGTTDTMCARRGVRTRGEVSCRGGRDVIINLKRWQLGVAWYPRLADYRDMVVNHEVGHFLGNGHVVCPRKDAPAPVMARQTFGLEGCARNPWPYPDGRTYVTGPAAPR
ncbi:DUF3152 domain-containing protein [Dactylosporangium aurantiacum]|uniref:DUF3152 domain-containing protein n=1 Tax=Dactylosporangium aurantiacum TaxID=35754 RepID=A0A9Q9MKE6_9ACTN|nr:DUF3152 domain-containing protein [Dactylosporangium aurantiacum]MDG6104887.1 DUF3152 domain-containing protein [Dactylosporangium aurantiacum]UWZ55571.1 DUF3152 domain-containing protein [Dactylosporangium aurantiacum]